MLTMEALRQIYARQGQAGDNRIGAVIFASPDIDMDVFSSSVNGSAPLATKHHRRHRDQRPGAGGVGMARRRQARRRAPRRARSRSSGCACDRRVAARLGNH
jgi:hypothetical protein